MRRSYVLEGVVVLEVWRHHAGVLLWRQRVFFGLLVAVIFLIVLIIVAALVFEVGRALVFVWSTIL